LDLTRGEDLVDLEEIKLVPESVHLKDEVKHVEGHHEVDNE
jgi:hypothetical protein